LHRLLQAAFAYLDNPYPIILHCDFIGRIPLATEAAEDAGVSRGVHLLPPQIKKGGAETPPSKRKEGINRCRHRRLKLASPGCHNEAGLSPASAAYP